jgi:nucleotide-binding universal stress UspA family protein
VRLAGNPVTALVTESQRLDLLVLGSRGRGPARSVLLGSVSTEVVREAACPVVVVARST